MQTRLACVLVAAFVAALPHLHIEAAQQGLVKSPRKIKDVKPVYPEQSLSRGDEGMVIVELKVGASGAVTDARVLRSTCPAFNDAALKATREWRFEKVLVNGVAAPFTTTAQVPFRLPEKLKSLAGRPGACRWVEPVKPIT